MKRKGKMLLSLLMVLQLTVMNFTGATEARTTASSRSTTGKPTPATSSTASGSHQTQAPKVTIVNQKLPTYSLHQSVEMSDLIADITITDSGKAISDQQKSTLFNASITKIYKGFSLAPDKQPIHIMEHGAVNYSYNGFPLFNKNDRMIVFLKKEKDKPNTYSIVGDEANVYKIQSMYGTLLAVKLYGNDPELQPAATYFNVNEIDNKLSVLDGLKLVQRDGTLVSNPSPYQVLDFNNFSSLLLQQTSMNKAGFSSSSPPAAIAATVPALIGASNQFGLNMLKAEAKNSSDKNLILSPLSLFTALNVAMTGAAGETRAQMKTVLGLSDFSDNQLNPAMNAWLNSVMHRYPNDSGITDVYNSLWIDTAFKPNTSFVNNAARFYNADVFTRKLAAKSTVDAMNSWVLDRSRGLIKNPIDAIAPNTRLAIFNVLYFYGSWSTPFPAESTKQEPFTLSSGAAATIDMMNTTEHIDFYEDASIKVGRLDYGNGHMLVLVPTSNLDGFLKNLDAKSITNYENKLMQSNCKIKMPKMNLSVNTELSDTLKSIGMQLPFDPDSADFSKMKANNDPLWIDQVIHDCVVKVDEKGTEAAALTAIMMKATATMPRVEEVKELYMNKPFLFLIQSQDNTTLFVGKVENPKQ